MQSEVVRITCDLCGKSFDVSPTAASNYSHRLPVLYMEDVDPIGKERIEDRDIDLCVSCLKRVIAIRVVAETRSTYIGGHDMAYVNQPTGREEYSFIKEDE